MSGRLGEILDGAVRPWVEDRLHAVVMHETTWFGIPMRKSPMDAWIQQELLHRVRPEVVVEIGSYAGGSTMFYAHLLDLLGTGTVVSVDKSRELFEAAHPRIVTVTGDSRDTTTVADVVEHCQGRRTMVIHDGDHSQDAVLADLSAYADLVTVGSYFIVEDAIVDYFSEGSALHPAKFRLGPLGGIQAFLERDGRFEIDRGCERYGVTYNPSGHLLRVR